MKKIYQEHLKVATSIENSSQKLMYLTSLLRSLLQVAVVTTFELTKKETPYDEVGLVDLVNRFTKPVDGLPLEILTQIIPTLRTYSSKKILLGWFEKTKNIDLSLDKQLREWVEFRNSRPAHGVVDITLANQWSIQTEHLIKNCLIVFDSILPQLNSEGVMKLSHELQNFEVTTPILYRNQIFVILSTSQKKGIWKLKGQIVSQENAEEFTIDLPENNIFSSQGLESQEKYTLVDFTLNNEEHILEHNIPVRQTDIFVGRELEINKLKEWMEDEDSRSALIYGDGGYGKTTLVLEFFNDLIESKVDFEKSPPILITYYTAKKTRWNEDGLIYFPNMNLAMDECIRELMRYFFPVLPKEWYQVSGDRIIDKAKSVLVAKDFTRDDILFIIDNTETLASTQEEVQELGLFFQLVGKKLGRIIITSRRREFIQATPIPIEGLKEEESISLMRSMAKKYNAKAILDSGEANLRKISNQLMYKPLLIDALVKYIAQSKLGIEKAMSHLFKKSNEELLEFLYEDAWTRMNDFQKEVFYVITHVQSPLNQNAIKKICQEIEIPYTEFLKALEETHFAIEQEYNNDYTIQLTSLSERFFHLQFKKLKDEKKERFERISQSVDKYLEDRHKIEQEYKTDRTAEAFRSEYAKSAKVYTMKGDNESAFDMYELAIEDDPVNSALHEKFAWFLLTKTQKFEYAMTIAIKAVKLNKNNTDATVVLALVHYRIGDIDNGDKYIDLARKLGRSLSFCLLRKGIARYHKAKKIDNIDERIELLDNSLKFLNSSESQNFKECGYDYKNSDDAIHYSEMTRKALSTSRQKRTRERKQK